MLVQHQEDDIIISNKFKISIFSDNTTVHLLHMECILLHNYSRGLLSRFRRVIQH